MTMLDLYTAIGRAITVQPHLARLPVVVTMRTLSGVEEHWLLKHVMHATLTLPNGGDHAELRVDAPTTVTR